jgi:hypothetical protein
LVVAVPDPQITHQVMALVEIQLHLQVIRLKAVVEEEALDQELHQQMQATPVVQEEEALVVLPEVRRLHHL